MAVTTPYAPSQLPPRMLNEYTYCPRLFYLEFVQQEWAHSVALSQSVERRSGKTHGGPDILLVAIFPRSDRRSVMDPTTGFCPKKNCPARGQSGQGHISLHSQQEQRFLCHAGHKTFSARPGTVFSRLRPSAQTVVLF